MKMRWSLFFVIATLVAAMCLDGGELRAAEEKAAGRNCRLIVDADTGEVLVREGPCEVRWTPCSTFKIPLAVMGYDSGILKDEQEPAWDYLPEYKAWRKEDERRVDPTLWEKNSVVWYSQKLTRTLGMEAFTKYVRQFEYGNQDVSGDPGKNNGLTDSWLVSSLLISPEEQVRFVRRLLNDDLGVGKSAYEMTRKILPRFPAEDGWTLTGKTGSGFQRKADGTLDRKMHVGWFAGWATRGAQRVVFAELLVDETPQEGGYGGPRSRDAIIKALPGLMRK